MKKVIGILGVAVIAATMLFSTNIINSSKSDTSLAGLIAVNTANAENDPDGDNCTKLDNSSCYVGTGLTFLGCDEDSWYTFSDCF